MEITSIESLVKLFFGLVIAAPGTAAMVVALVSIGKLFGLVRDGAAPQAVNLLNVVFALGLGVVAVFFPAVNLAGVDDFLRGLSGMLTAFLPLLALLVRYLAPLFYKALRGVPLLGYHYSKK